MGAILKNLPTQLMRSSAKHEPISRICLDDSLGQIRTANLKEVQRLSRFVAIVVLIPKSNAKDQSVLPKIAAKSLGENSETSKLLRQLTKTVQEYENTNAQGGELGFGDAAVNFSTMEAWHNGKPVTLTAMEFKVLKYMSRHEGRVISRDELLNEVWGYENYPCTRTVDNHILRLRLKLERDPSRPIHFRTVHSVGYKFLRG